MCCCRMSSFLFSSSLNLKWFRSSRKGKELPIVGYGWTVCYRKIFCWTIAALDFLSSLFDFRWYSEEPALGLVDRGLEEKHQHPLASDVVSIF